MAKIVEVFWRFLCLGCVSFGGPAAHIGYFHTAFVQKLKWIDEASYSRLVAFSQFLPGPGSSQVGFALGIRRAGIFGGIAAFLGFTIPSFLILYFVAIYQPNDVTNSAFSGVIAGLKLLAVVVVADACYKMFNSFCNSKTTTFIAIGTCALTLIAPSLLTQIFVLLVGAIIGFKFIRNAEQPTIDANLNSRPNWPILILFLCLLFALPFIAGRNELLALFSNFYQAGSLVFGGGHVVLPLLSQSIGDAISSNQFLAGYASAQAIPGPMFALAAYLGTVLTPNLPLIGAIVATLGIFVPGFLLVLSLHNSWEALSSKAWIAGAANGINATVVGLLLAALYQPVFTSAVNAPIDMAFIIFGLFALNVLRLPIVLLVFSFIAIGLGRYLLG